MGLAYRQKYRNRVQKVKNINDKNCVPVVSFLLEVKVWEKEN